MTNSTNTVTYTGVTNYLKRRIYEHKNNFGKGFTTMYNIDKLVYYEIFGDTVNAITREKQIKAVSRKAKVTLVNSMNKEWRDLYMEL